MVMWPNFKKLFDFIQIFLVKVSECRNLSTIYFAFLQLTHLIIFDMDVDV